MNNSMFLFYEGNDPSKFDDLTGENLNKQAKHLNEVKLSKIEADETYVKTEDIVNTLDSSDQSRPLSAGMGKKLNESKLDKEGNAKTASKLKQSVKLNISSDSFNSTQVDFDGSTNLGIPLVWKCVQFDASIIDEVESDIKGRVSQEPYIILGRSEGDTQVSFSYSTTIFAGTVDTESIISIKHDTPAMKVSGGEGNKVHWTKDVAFTDSDITGNSATTTKLKTPVNIVFDGDVKGGVEEFDGSKNIEVTLSLNKSSGEFTVDENTGDLATVFSENVSNIIRRSAGVYEIIYSDPLPSDDYCITINSSGSYLGHTLLFKITEKTVEHFIVEFPVLLDEEIVNRDQKSMTFQIIM